MGGPQSGGSRKSVRPSRSAMASSRGVFRAWTLSHPSSRVSGKLRSSFWPDSSQARTTPTNALRNATKFICCRHLGFLRKILCPVGSARSFKRPYRLPPKILSALLGQPLQKAQQYCFVSPAAILGLFCTFGEAPGKRPATHFHPPRWTPCRSGLDAFSVQVFRSVITPLAAAALQVRRTRAVPA